MKPSDKRTLVLLLLAAALLVMVPLVALRGAEFGGSDDAGSNMVTELRKDYKPIATPILEQVIGGELPSEMETLFFCLQTGVGVGVIAFFMGRMVERKQWERRLSATTTDGATTTEVST